MRLGIGTVQFGLDYGISNAAGKTPRAEVGRILACAGRHGIDLLDTAALYGDSEAALGASLPAGERWRIVTKTPVFPAAAHITAIEADELRRSFAGSLERLGQSRLYGLLLHAPADLLKPGGERLWQTMLALKASGAVEKIGYSVYGPADLRALLADFRPDLVQVPLSALDQRLLRDGRLAGLKRLGVEVHARSVFLQGLLLMEPAQLPAALQGRRELTRYAAFLAAHGLGRIEGALQFIRSVASVDVALVGVAWREQLEQCVDAFRPPTGALPDFAQVACDDERLLNPATWPAQWRPGGTA